MRKDVFGIIYAGEDNLNLRDLVNLRSVGALPVGARYRVVDFMLSNLVNSGIKNIGIIPRKNYHSLMNHLGSGKEWDLNSKSGGLIIIPPYDTSENIGSYHGLIDTLKGADSYIRHVSQEYCLLMGSSNIHSGVYNKLYDFHIKSGADITMLYDSVDDSVKNNNIEDVRLSTNEQGRVVEMSVNNTAHKQMNLGVYLIKKDLLQYLVADATSRGKYNFTTDILMNNLSKLKIYGMEHTDYVGRIHSVASYYQVNMDFLNPTVQRDLFYSGKSVYTRIRDEAPTKYGADSKVKNSIIGSGCFIDGVVENCILFRGVHIAKGAIVKNSIIMQNSEIYAGSSLNHVILDKKVNVRPNSILIGSKNYPVMIPKGANI